MFKKSIYFVSFVLVPGIVLTSGANAADPNLMSWWKFDGDALDYSGNERHGTLHGSPQFGPGVFGEALEFEGNPDYVTIDGYKGVLGTHAFSITAWVKTSNPANIEQIVHWGAHIDGQRVEFRINSTRLRISHGGGNVQGNTDLIDGEWHHVAAVVIDNATASSGDVTFYVDGEDDTMESTDPDAWDIVANDTLDVTIGWRPTQQDRPFIGSMDDIRIYDKVLAQEEVQAIMEGGGEAYPFALGPDPVDGALIENTWTNISWSAGDFAVSHDVYIGESFEDVNKGTEETFHGNQATTTLIIGFPGFAYPDGLVPGTTYYWRIDEVNDLHPDSPWKGKVWSFSIPPLTAYKPNPADGAKFVDPNAELSWTGGFGAKLHTVYFGDNFDDANSAVVGLPQAATTYAPGPLELEKIYYWRIDEFDGAATHKGDVWSFTITKAGGGLKAEYFNNTTLSGEPALTRTDPEIDFNWSNADVPGENSPDASINVNNFSARWSGELEVDLTDSYTFNINANNGFRLWLDGRLIIDFWGNPTTSSRDSEPIDLAGGETYSIRMEYFEGDDVAIAQLFWESGTREQQIIPSGALQPPLKAGSPSPFNGAVDVKQTGILSWSASDAAASHQVYFGINEEAVKNTNTGSPEYKGTRNLGSESHDPGKLEWDTAYYWRVDEVEADGTIQKGKTWSFTTANFLIVDDFEDYDAGENQIWYAWKDGLGYGTPGTDPYYAGNGTGSAVGDENTPSYTEETIVHGGRQAMPLAYDNNKQGFFNYSEAELTLTYPRDWTENGVNMLTIWFRGDSANAAEPLYVALNGSAVVTNDNPDAAQVVTWTEWNIDLQAFADQGLNLANVNTIALGLGNKNNPLAGGAGMMYFDDIRLYRPAP